MDIPTTRGKEGREQNGAVNESNPAAVSSVFSGDSTKKISRGMSDDERYQILLGKTLSLSATADDSKLDKAYKKIQSDGGNINLNGVSTATRRKLVKKIANEFEVFKRYFNPDIKLDFNFSNANLRESIDKQERNYQFFAKMLTCFDEVIENAVGIEVHNRNNDGYKTDPTLQNMYVLVSAFQNIDDIIPVKFEIKEFSDKQNALYIAVALESIKKDRIDAKGTSKNGVAQFANLSSTISIVDFLKNVNPNDTNFTKYFPEQVRTEEQSKRLKEMEDKRNGTQSRAFPQELLNDATMTNEQIIAVAREKARELVRTTGEPHVTIQWSESADFKSGDVLSLTEADKKLAALDSTFTRDGYYDKVKLHIDYIKDGNASSYEGCRFDIGTERQGLVGHIQSYWDFYLNNPMRFRLNSKGNEPTSSGPTESDYAYMANDLAPFFKYHRDLSDMITKAEEMGMAAEEVDKVRAFVRQCRMEVNGVAQAATVTEEEEHRENEIESVVGKTEEETPTAQPISYRDRVSKIRDEMAQTLLDYIKQNPQDWQKGWNNLTSPINGKTNTSYRGFNALYLALIGMSRGYDDPRWVTFNQAKDLGASIKRGEKSSPVLFFEFYDRLTKKAYNARTTKDMTDEERAAYEKENVYAVLKYSSVFNASQCANFPERDLESLKMSEEDRANQNELIETIIANSAAPVNYDGGNRAFYSPSTDSIHLPALEAFSSMQDYYATALHEIAHSTGHASRLHRDLTGDHGSPNYAIEELRAELACVYMQIEQGIQLDGEHIENHAAYLSSWLDAVKNDKSIFFKAASDAQKIADYVSAHYVQSVQVDELKLEDENEAQSSAEDSPMAEYLRTEQDKRDQEQQNVLESRLNANVREWYQSAFPTDELGAELDGGLTFKDVLAALSKGDNIYDVLGAYDSVVRERLFWYLAEIQDKSYEEIYDTWATAGTQQEGEHKEKVDENNDNNDFAPYVTDGSMNIEGYKKMWELRVLDENVKQWYISTFPEDSVGATLDDYTTFVDINESVYNPTEQNANIYEVLGGRATSEVRDRVFTHLAEIKGVTFDEIFNAWKQFDYRAQIAEQQEHRYLRETRYGSPVNGIAEVPVGSGKYVAIIDNSEQKEDAFSGQYPPSFIIAHDYNPTNGEWQTGAFGFTHYEEAREYYKANYNVDIGENLLSEVNEDVKLTENIEAAENSIYYPINEEAAKRAKEANSYSDYVEGSATALYRQSVDKAVKLAAKQKERVDPMHHQQIDSLVHTYARKLAENLNARYVIDARVPSILITGGGNFPVGKKMKQNAAREKNTNEWQEIQGLLDKIRSVGLGGISSDDPNSIQKLEAKLASLEKSQETMKAVNAYYRTHKTLEGCPHLTKEQLTELREDIRKFPHLEGKPYASWQLSNNNAEMHRIRSRIQELKNKQEVGFVGWVFDGGEVQANVEANRLQIVFDERPDDTTRSELKSNGFRWSPTNSAWQRQLNGNAYYAADRISAIQPIDGSKPTDLQRAHVKRQKQASNVSDSGEHKEEMTVEQARNAMLDAQEQRQNHYAVRIETAPYSDPEDGYESSRDAQVIYAISQNGLIEPLRTITVDDDAFYYLPYTDFLNYERVEYEELEDIAKKVREPIQKYKDVLRAELETDTERRRSDAYYDQRVNDILDEHYRTENGLFKREIENPRYLSGMLYAEETFRGERVVSLTQDKSGKNVAILARIGGSFAVAEDYHTDDGRNWGRYHFFENQKLAEEFIAKNFTSTVQTDNSSKHMAQITQNTINTFCTDFGGEYTYFVANNGLSIDDICTAYAGRPYDGFGYQFGTPIKAELYEKIQNEGKGFNIDFLDDINAFSITQDGKVIDSGYLYEDLVLKYQERNEHDTPPNMPQATQNKPVEAQERKREWLSIELPEGSLGKQYGANTMVKMPEGEYSYFSLFVPTKFIKTVDGKQQLRVASDFTYRLNNDGRQVELTGQELRDSFAGMPIGKQYKRVAPSRAYAKVFADLEKNVPEEMKALPNWCVYRTWQREDKDKKGKVLKSAVTGEGASSKNPGDWTDFHTAMKYAKENGFAGVSFLLEAKNGITCIDLDECVLNAETGEMKERATKLIDSLKGTYMERSTSGNGVHIFIKDDILKGGKYRSTAVDAQKGDLEVFDNQRVISMTGNMFSETNTLTRAGSAATVYLRKELGEQKQRPIVADSHPRPSSGTHLSDSELVRWIRSSKKASDFDALYSGKGLSGDKSNDDAKLAHILLFFSGGDKEQTLRIIRESGQNRADKPDSYYRHTIEKMDEKITEYAKLPSSLAADGAGRAGGRRSGGGNNNRGTQA